MTESGDITWHDAMPLAELQDSTPHAVQLGATLVVLVKIGEQVYAVDCVCTHEFALLSDGYVDGKTIECPLHAARFDLETGKVIDGPTDSDLGAYPVQVSAGLVRVGMPTSNN